MPEEFIITDGSPFTAVANDLADSGDLDAKADVAGTNAVEVTGVIHDGDCDVKYVVENAAGSEIVNITLDSLTGSGVKVLSPQVPIVENDRQFVRVTNTSGGAADFVVVGYEVE